MKQGITRYRYILYLDHNKIIGSHYKHNWWNSGYKPRESQRLTKLKHFDCFLLPIQTDKQIYNLGKNFVIANTTRFTVCNHERRNILKSNLSPIPKKIVFISLFTSKLLIQTLQDFLYCKSCLNENWNETNHIKDFTKFNLQWISLPLTFLVLVFFIFNQFACQGNLYHKLWIVFFPLMTLTINKTKVIKQTFSTFEWVTHSFTLTYLLVDSIFVVSFQRCQDSGSLPKGNLFCTFKPMWESGEYTRIFQLVGLYHGLVAGRCCNRYELL